MSNHDAFFRKFSHGYLHIHDERIQDKCEWINVEELYQQFKARIAQERKAERDACADPCLPCVRGIDQPDGVTR